MARVLAAVSGEAPLAEGARLLAPDVVCHMDQFTAHGVDAWVDWVEFIRSRGVENVRVVVERFETGADGIITALGGVTTQMGRGAQRRPGGVGRERARGVGGSARYRVVGGRIVEIWTSRWNYEMIFGAKVRHPLRWLLVLVWMAVWRRLPWRRRALVSPTRGGLGDPEGNGGGSTSRRSGSAHDHPEW